MSVRKELLERELKKLGFRKAAAQGNGSAHESSPSSQNAGPSGHPQAEDAAGESHAD